MKLVSPRVCVDIFLGCLKAGFHLSHDTERTQHTRWSLGNLDNRGSLMKVKNNRELDQFHLRASLREKLFSLQ